MIDKGKEDKVWWKNNLVGFGLFGEDVSKWRWL